MDSPPYVFSGSDRTNGSALISSPPLRINRICAWMRDHRQVDFEVFLRWVPRFQIPNEQAVQLKMMEHHSVLALL